MVICWVVVLGVLGVEEMGVGSERKILNCGLPHFYIQVVVSAQNINKYILQLILDLHVYMNT